MDWKLELVVVPVSDVNRAKAFYTEQAGFQVDVDRQLSPDFRVVQLTPPGSACSITLMRNLEAPGSLQGLHLVVSDIEAAGRARRARDGSERDLPLRVGSQPAGAGPCNAADRVPFSFSDPDGNSRSGRHGVHQEVRAKPVWRDQALLTW